METPTRNKQLFCDDIEAWRAFREGDAAAYASLYQRYVSLLYQYTYKIAGSADVAKDCVQDFFIGLWKNKSALGEPDSVRNYLLKSIRRKAIRSANLRRMQHYKGKVAAAVHEGSHLYPRHSEFIPDEPLRLRKRCLEDAVKELSSPQQEVLFLKFSIKLTYSEISSVMSISVDMVHKLISDALCNVKSRVRKEELLYRQPISFFF